MFYYYCSKKQLQYNKTDKLSDGFHKAFYLRDEIEVHWGSFINPIAKDFIHRTALLAFNNKGEIISAIGFGSQGYIKVLECIEKINELYNELTDNHEYETFEELNHFKDEFVDLLDIYSVQKI